jgi:hypothetical protein
MFSFLELAIEEHPHQAQGETMRPISAGPSFFFFFSRFFFFFFWLSACRNQKKKSQKIKLRDRHVV